MTGKMRSPLRILALLWTLAWFGASAFFGTRYTAAHRLDQTLRDSSLSHPGGCDAFGRDLIALTLKASILSSGIALGIVLICVLIALFLGSTLALAPARARRWGESALELALAFPSLLVALGWAAVRGPGWSTLFVAIGFGVLPSFTRLSLARAREIGAEPFFDAARSFGAGRWSLSRNHLLPELLDLSRIKLPILFAHALLAEATLSFLGIGAPLGRDTWGSLLAQGREYLLEAPHIAVVTGIPLVLTILALQILSGEGEGDNAARHR